MPEVGASRTPALFSQLSLQVPTRLVNYVELLYPNIFGGGLVATDKTNSRQEPCLFSPPANHVQTSKR